MAFLAQYSRTEPKSITRRRDIEEARLRLNERVSNDLSVNENAKWEVRTHAMMQTQAVKQLERALAQREHASLQDRRARLAAMLTAEDEQYRQELAGLMESSGDRAKRLVKEARRLKTEREDKRRAFAEEQLERQWKEGCDDLRTIDSSFFKQHCATEVVKQIEEKQGRRARDEHEKQRWAVEWEAERLKRVEIEDNKSRMRASALIDNRRDLKQQLDEQEAAAAREAANLAQEKAIFSKILEMDARAAHEKSIADHERKRALQRDTVAYNEQLQAEREAAYRAQRAADKAELQQKMAEYKEDTLRVENDKARQRADILEFRAYLRRRKEDERRMEQELERLVQEDLDRANLQRDVQWERERLARDRLMKDVYDTRARQMDDKAAAKAREEEELFMEKRAAEIEVARVHEQELAELREEKLAMQRRLRDLDSQVSINRERKRLAREELMAELRQAEEAERVYKQKLEQFRVNTIEQSKRNYGIKGGSTLPSMPIQHFSRP